MRRAFWLLMLPALVVLARLVLGGPGLSQVGIRRIESLIDEGIREGRMPGAVMLVGHRGRVVYRKAFGRRAIEPKPEPMTVDTIFDLSSLTKLVATATSVMLLIERGQLQLSDPLGRYLPEIRDPEARRLSIEQLLTHTSGYPTQLDLRKPWSGREGALRELARECITQDRNFHYSDINYIALGMVVERVTDQSLATFSRENIFEPLGIARTTTFCPPADLVPIAPTEWRDGEMLRGKVHSPQAERMGGIAGNAGLFSRADDLARYCQMFLDHGQYGGRPILAASTVELMVRPVVVSPQGATRGLGWDIDSSLATSRGDFFPRGSFGHTGYAGVSLWVDPTSQTYAIFLCNMVHPRGEGDVKSLRARLFSVVADSLTDFDPEGWRQAEQAYSQRVAAGLKVSSQRAEPAVMASPVLLRGQAGVETLSAAQMEPWKTGRTGLVTVPETSTARILKKAGLNLAGLDPESQESLSGLQRLVIDLPLVGCASDRTTRILKSWLERAARAGIRVIVLDRPNPLGGVSLEGPLLEKWGLPLRHGLTTGELASYFNLTLKVPLEVVKMKDWRRQVEVELCGQDWIPPEPDVQTLDALILYPALRGLESPQISVGRGTARAFQWFGAPWLDARRMADLLNRQQVPGVRFVATGGDLPGCQIVVVDRARLRSLRVGLEIGGALRRLYPKRWRWQFWASSFEDAATLQMLQEQERPEVVEKAWEAGLAGFRKFRKTCLLYEDP